MSALSHLATWRFLLRLQVSVYSTRALNTELAAFAMVRDGAVASWGPDQVDPMVNKNFLAVADCRRVEGSLLFGAETGSAQTRLAIEQSR